MKNKINGLFLTGFLGSGKTTTSIEFLAEALTRGLSVKAIVNDLGRQNIDAERIKRAFPDLDIEDLSNACIGCNGSEEFYQKIREAHERDTKLLIVEPTGILTGEEMTQIAYDTRDICDFKVATLIHIPRFLRQGVIETSKEATASQLPLARLVGFTWCNKLERFEGSGDERLFKAYQLVGAYAPKARVHIVENAEDGLRNPAFMDAIFGVLNESSTEIVKPDHAHHHKHGEGSRSVANITLRKEINSENLPAYCGPILSQLERAKGDLGSESFNFTDKSWVFTPLKHEGSRFALFISKIGGSFPEGFFEKISEGPAELPPPTVEEIESAVEELLQETAPLRPIKDSVLPIDGQTYLAWSYATSPGVRNDLRQRAITVVMERLIEACGAIREIGTVPLSAKRSAGAFLSFFVETHKEELSPSMIDAVIAADPIPLLAEGLLGLTCVGVGTGIGGATVRPSFLKHALEFARRHASASLPDLIRAFKHIESIALPDDRTQWEDLYS